MDEARYGRTCLLILNICPFTLRRVINDYYQKQGSLSFHDFLEVHKHDLFHLLFRRCCCRSIQSNVTPMYKSQIELLFSKNSSSCMKGIRGECPCQYDAKNGVTTDVMDVTLCCTMIKNICPGINLSHIDTIRDVRNKVIHADSACMDNPTYVDYWKRVETAIRELANSVSRGLYTETLTMVQELENRLMNAEELGELRNLLVDEKRIKDIEEDLNDVTVRVLTVEKDVDIATRQMEQIEGNVSEMSQRVANLQEIVGKSYYSSQGRVPSGETPDISKLRQRLMKINEDTTKVASISPFQERGGDEIPIQLLYASVVVRENTKYSGKTQDCSYHSKYVTGLSEIFMVDDNVVSTIYMLGDAAHGKTIYCIWLVKKWCNAQISDHKGSIGYERWEKVMGVFDFVFLVQFRNVNQNRASVVDMICHDVFGRDEEYHSAIRHVLKSDNFRSLIILDGLDEWNPTEETKKLLTHKGMPNIEGVSSHVSCFISMRPWMFPKISKLVKVDDKIIEIHGLSEAGMEKVIQNVLLNHYKLEESSSKYIATHKSIVEHLKKKSLKSFMQIPLLAVVCVQIWCEGKQVGDSMTSFYANMVDMLLQRGNEKFEEEMKFDKTNQTSLPEAFSDYENMQNCGVVLLKLGKVAYEGLIPQKDNLIFQKRKLEKEIGVRELQFALDVGLISQKEAPSILTKNVSVHFFHKSVQEFLAAIHIVSKEELSDSFCQLLSELESIMRLSNVIMFICGMSPSLGSVISQCVVSATDHDEETSKYRESGLVSSKMKEMYKLQTSWYKEFRCGQRDKFSFSDVYLSYDENDLDTVRITSDLLSANHNEIRSLSLYHVPIDEHKGITNEVLNAYLGHSENTRSLVMLYVCGENSNRILDTISAPALQVLRLEHVSLQNRYFESNIPYPLIAHMPCLRKVEMKGVTIGESRRIGISADMTDLERLKLESVKMSSEEWNIYVTTLSSILHKLYVHLDYTDVDEESLNLIRTSPNFNVSRDGVNKFGRYIHFDKKGPEDQNPQ